MNDQNPQTYIRTELLWTEGAWNQYKAIRNQAHAIRANWGDALGDRALASIGHCLDGVLSAGRTEAYKDHDGLLFVTPHITMGMVFHADSQASVARVTGYEIAEVQRCLTFAATPGTWSLHS